MATMKMLYNPELLIRASASVGEGPMFDPRSGHLCWVDITAGQLHETRLDTRTTTTLTLGMSVGAAVPRRTHSGLAVAVADGFGIVGHEGFRVVDPVLPESFRRMNDAKCDSRGRMWAGSTHNDFQPGGGALHRWDGSGPSEVIAEGFTLPNGIGWSPDDTQMYLIDSMTHEVLVAEYSPADGLVGPFRTLCRVEGGLPDGLAIDVDGCLWIAVWGGGVVQRVAPSGTLISQCVMPVTQPSSCAFGDDGTLVITTARAGLSPAQLQAQPLAGSIFGLATRTRGVPVGAFDG